MAMATDREEARKRADRLTGGALLSRAALRLIEQIAQSATASAIKRRRVDASLRAQSDARSPRVASVLLQPIAASFTRRQSFVLLDLVPAPDEKAAQNKRIANQLVRSALQTVALAAQRKNQPSGDLPNLLLSFMAARSTVSARDKDGKQRPNAPHGSAMTALLGAAAATTLHSTLDAMHRRNRSAYLYLQTAKKKLTPPEAQPVEKDEQMFGKLVKSALNATAEGLISSTFRHSVLAIQNYRTLFELQTGRLTALERIYASSPNVLDALKMGAMLAERNHAVRFAPVEKAAEVLGFAVGATAISTLESAWRIQRNRAMQTLRFATKDIRQRFTAKPPEMSEAMRNVAYLTHRRIFDEATRFQTPNNRIVM
jgi:hypothetical protein